MSSVKKIEADILVAGAGMAGLCAALAAARNGATVILCQDRPVLGGNASSEIRVHICGAAGFRGKAMETEVREGGIIEEIKLDSAAKNPNYSPYIFDLLLYDKCIENDKICLLLNTTVTGVTVKGKKIVAAHALRSSTEDEFKLSAHTFIDSTGDGRLGFEAGALHTVTRESSDAYGESLAPAEADNYKLGSSLLFKAVDTGKPVEFTSPLWARKFTAKDLKKRDIYGYESGYWWIEYGGMQDTIKDNEAIKHELLRIVLGIWDYIKNSGHHPKASTYALEWLGFLPGKRESRRFIGHHLLTQNDIQCARIFTDAVAYGGWPFDSHPIAGIDAKADSGCDQPLMPCVYQIPMSCCVSKNIKNLLFAGRNISATHVAFTSTRVMATCAALGQAVGTFAAIAAGKGLSSDKALYNSSVIGTTQQTLLNQDAYIPGVKRDRTDDLASLAFIVASSQQHAGKADNVIDGHTRSDHGINGARADCTTKGSHRWMSDADDKNPWIELKWEKPVDIGCVEIIFDTGMHRRLALTQEPHFRKIMLWQPQPETVRDFKIFADCGDCIQEIDRVRGNYQRYYKLIKTVKKVRRLRIQIDATNGIDHARIFEIRCRPEKGTADICK